MQPEAWQTTDRREEDLEHELDTVIEDSITEELQANKLVQNYSHEGMPKAPSPKTKVIELTKNHSRSSSAGSMNEKELIKTIQDIQDLNIPNVPVAHGGLAALNRQAQ